jgi:hypothetical protein
MTTKNSNSLQLPLNNIINKDHKFLQSKKKELSSSKKFQINEYSSEKLNSKRLFSEHVKSLDEESRKNVTNPVNNKKFKSNQTFKIVGNGNNNKSNSSIINNKSNKSTQLKLVQNSQKEKFELPNLPKINYNLTNIDSCQFYCLCVNSFNNSASLNSQNISCDV